jgi:HSP20 family molecular chaperone IbpA
MAKHYVLKEDISITFTPDEIWQLIVICEGDKVFNQNAMRQYRKGSRVYNDYKELYDWAEKMQQKIIDIRNANGVLEDV